MPTTDTHITTDRFKAASAKALSNPRLQAYLGRSMGHFDGAREDAIAEITPQRWEELREQAREIKRHTLDNLDYYLELLTERVTKNGGQVHFARDAAEAKEIVGAIARTKGLKLAIKSKSMVSEEMRLNDYLETVGVEPVETDLGEYIIQLANEPPSHIIAPALHKSKEEVSQLFAEKINRPNLVEIEAMAHAAREVLRDKLVNADMGITGGNFLVAETGTLVLVTNEGNGRFCTSVPRVVVSIVGMEKVIPSLEDLRIFIRLLPRSATGQRISSYTTHVSGPRRADDEDGPEEWHLVIVDNGRSRLLRDPHLRESLYCIRCGACLNICPVYRKVGGHAYGWVYPGPIGAVVTPVLVGLDKAKDLPQASSLCGACRDVCPIKINIPHMLLRLRSHTAEGTPDIPSKAPFSEKFMSKAYLWLMSSPARLGSIRTLGRLAQAPLARRGRIRRVPLPPFSTWTRSRDLQPLAPKPFRQLWKERLSREQ
ncbi:MAG: iron-sulfur cluster-binding protein [SAR202 cluster bacterium]|nr:iron-sulfur cluster-binding protein [SAR202 cluster bacterium]